MKKNKNNQNGAISLFVLISMMFFLAFILGTYTIASRRKSVQIQDLSDTQRIYSRTASAKDQYDSIFLTDSTNSLVPITNLEQLKIVKNVYDGTAKYKYFINGKIYTFEKDSNFVLKNDIILDLEDTINEKNNLQDIIYDYMLYNSSYNLNSNGYSIYYKKDDGSIWKLISYQNIGSINSSNLFSSDSASANYYGKSYSSKLFSIMEDGISSYSNNWICLDNTTRNFEFMLMYTRTSSQIFDTSKYNRWRQTYDPSKIKDKFFSSSEVDGYTINFEGGTTEGLGTGKDALDMWGGLARPRSTSSYGEKSYLTGSMGTYWYYAVGVTEWYKKTLLTNSTYGIPTSRTTGENEDSATECLFFVRYK